MNTISCNIVPVQIEFLIVLKYDVELLCNDPVFFEILKMKIRSVSITYSIRKSRDEKEKTLKLKNIF
jgi:hypothetical protein